MNSSIESRIRRFVNRGEVDIGEVSEIDLTTTITRFYRSHRPFAFYDEMVEFEEQRPGFNITLPDGTTKLLILDIGQAPPAIGTKIEVGRRFPMWSKVE